MFATLLGTNRETEEHTSLCAGLCRVAVAQGFVPPDTRLRVQPDQTPLAGWQIELRGPADAKADFLLSVTAPKVPSISPIPVMKTVSGPLFSVIVMPGFLGVHSDAVREYSEFKENSQVKEAFEGFCRALQPGTTDIPPTEFGLYVDSLFFGRVVCSICGSEFSLGARPAQDDATRAVPIARDAIARGWRLSAAAGSKPLCPQCAPGALP